MFRINLVFHKISICPKGDWEVSPKYFLEIFDWCEKNCPNFRIYFDDGYSMDCIKKLLPKIAKRTTLAIVTNDIGKNGFLSWVQLKHLKDMGFKIASHGTSHASLAAYDKSNLQILKNPLEGEYVDVSRGRQLLTVNQVKYQLIESKKTLATHGFEVDEFVFPYGLYSKQTLSIMDKLKAYRYYATCDAGLYLGGKIVPRFIIYGTKSAKENILCLTNFIGK